MKSHHITRTSLIPSQINAIVHTHTQDTPGTYSNFPGVFCLIYKYVNQNTLQGPQVIRNLSPIQQPQLFQAFSTFSAACVSHTFWMMAKCTGKEDTLVCPI